MKKPGGIAALAGAIIALCAVVAWAWYARLSHPPAPQPVQQIAAGSPSPRPAPARKTSPSASPAPVVYVPQAVVSSPSHASRVSARPTAAPAPAFTPAAFAANGVTATAAVEPMVAATLAPHVLHVNPIVASPDAPPRIVSMSMSTPVAHAGDVVSGTVETSSNVASVEARIAGYSSSMRKVGVGRFAMSYRVPKLPFFLHRTYTIEVIARNARGDAVRTSVPITIR